MGLPRHVDIPEGERIDTPEILYRIRIEHDGQLARAYPTGTSR